MRNSAFALFAVLAACAGKTSEAPPSTSTTPSALTADDLTKRWEHVTVLAQQKRIFEGPNGFYAFTSRETGNGKDASYAFDAVYQSADGVTWHRLAMLNDGSKPFAHYQDVTYGNGRFVAVGWANGATGTLTTSTDGVTWTPNAEPAGINAVAYANDRFIAGFAPNDFQVSSDASSWTTVPRPLMQMRSAAFGNGTYVVFGSCGMETSLDGATWTDTTPSCSSPGLDCVRTPDGQLPASGCIGLEGSGFFGGGQFWVEGLTSTDGKTWSPIVGAKPHASAGGMLFGNDASGNPNAWQPGEAPVLLTMDEVASADAKSGTEPDTVTVAFPNDATCNDHRCIIVDRDLYLLE